MRKVLFAISGLFCRWPSVAHDSDKMNDDSRREVAPFVRVEQKRHATLSISSDSSDDDGRIDAPLVKQCRSSGDITIVPKRITIKDSVEDLESAYLENAPLSHLTEELSYVSSKRRVCREKSLVRH